MPSAKDDSEPKAFSVEPQHLQSLAALHHRVASVAAAEAAEPAGQRYLVSLDHDAQLQIVCERTLARWGVRAGEAAAAAACRLPTEREARQLYEQLLRDGVLLPGELPTFGHFHAFGLVAVGARLGARLWRRPAAIEFPMEFRTRDNQRLSVDFDGSVTFGALKDRFTARFGVPQRRLVFVHGGKTMLDRNTIAQHKITKYDAVIHLVQRRGGDRAPFMEKAMDPPPNAAVAVAVAPDNMHDISVKFDCHIPPQLLLSFVKPRISVFRVDGDGGGGKMCYSHARHADLPAPTRRWAAAVRDALVGGRRAVGASAAAAAASAAPQRVDRDSLELILQYALDACRLGARFAASAPVRLEHPPQPHMPVSLTVLVRAALEPNAHYVAVVHSADRSPFDFVQSAPAQPAAAAPAVAAAAAARRPSAEHKRAGGGSGGGGGVSAALAAAVAAAAAKEGVVVNSNSISNSNNAAKRNGGGGISSALVAALLAAVEEEGVIVLRQPRHDAQEWRQFPHTPRPLLADIEAEIAARATDTTPPPVDAALASEGRWRAAAAVVAAQRRGRGAVAGADSVTAAYAHALVQTCWHFYTTAAPAPAPAPAPAAAAVAEAAVVDAPAAARAPAAAPAPAAPASQ